MQKLINFYLVLTTVFLLSCSKKDQAQISSDDKIVQRKVEIYSPDNILKLEFALNPENRPYYTVYYKDSLILENSALGLIRDDADFSKNINLTGTFETTVVQDEYVLLHGKQRNNFYEANKKTIHLENEEGLKMDIIFQLSNDGVAFRYHFPDSSLALKRIAEEKTSFHFPESSRAWLQPMSEAKTGFEQTNPSYEEHYLMDIPVGTPSPIEAGWVYPALFKSGNAWILITEAALGRTYCATRLAAESEGGEYFIRFPMEQEVIPPGEALNPQSNLPWSSPWRIITIGSLETIVESTLGTDLAEEQIEVDTSFIEPGLASWSWALLKDRSITFDIQKSFIDYAADMKWKHCLIDVNWDTTIGYDSIEILASYANSKGVNLHLWYNSAGDWNTVSYHPKDKLLTHEDRSREFERIKDMGIAGIKVDFFGGDGQSVINYYHDIMKDAAEFQLMLNFHGATLPRGWHRTYPHLMTVEAIRGFEFITFFQETANQEPSHSAILPFTRNAFDPMDFTPTSLYDIPNIERVTTSAFELALPVLFLSGVQHIAEIPQRMDRAPGFVKDYLKDIPTDWDETEFINGYPGKLVILARRKGENWFVSGINGENEIKSITIDLSFIGDKEGIMISEGDEQFSFKKSPVNLAEEKVQKLELRGNGGFIMKF